MHRLCAVATILFAVSAAGGASAAGGNLVADGGFEQYGPVPSWVPLTAGSEAVPGWRVASGSADLVGRYFRAFEGTNSFEVGTPGAGAVEQTLATTAGARYRLSFALAGNPEGPPRVKRLVVSAGSTSRTFAFDVTGRTREALGWRTESLRFTATGSSTVLRFARLDGGATAWWGPLIDDVRVVQSDGSAPPQPPAAVATRRPAPAPAPSEFTPSGNDAFSGLWTGAYPGQPLRVFLERHGNNVVAHAVDGSDAIPAGHIAWEGRVDRTPIVVLGACADPGAKGWHGAVIEWSGQNVFTLRVADCHAGAILYTRTP